MNSLNIIGRVHGTPHFAFVGQSNRPLLKFLLTHVRKTGTTNRHIEIGVMLWGAKAEVAHAAISTNAEIAVSGSLDFDQFSVLPEERKTLRPILVADSIMVTSRPAVPGQSV